MPFRRILAATIFFAGSVSCASNSSSAKPITTPTAGTGVAAAPAPRAVPPPSTAPSAAEPGRGGPPDGRQGGPPGGGRGFGRRPQLTPEQVAARRDSLTAMRAAVEKDLMARIAGNEMKSAGEEFTNVKLMKDSTAANFLKQMDYYGRSLSVGCEFCHVGGGKWDDDSKEEKQTTRVMIEMVNMINTQSLSKLGGQRPPRISCVTCHRGRNNPGQALLPQ